METNTFGNPLGWETSNHHSLKSADRGSFDFMFLPVESEHENLLTRKNISSIHLGAKRFQSYLKEFEKSFLCEINNSF